MVIEVCGWRIEPYQTGGRRCWQLYHGRRTRPERFYDDLGKALDAWNRRTIWAQ